MSGLALLEVDRSDQLDLSQLPTSPLSPAWDDPQALWNDPQKLWAWRLAGRLVDGARQGQESPEDRQSWKQSEQGLAPGHRGRHYKLHDGMVEHGLTRGGVSKCRRCRIAAEVGVVLTKKKGARSRARYTGLMSCGSVSACPVCGNKIRASRGKELVAMVAAHGSHRTLMLTATVRHGLGDNFADLVRGVSSTWTEVLTGKEWKILRESFGLLGMTRALETTHGPKNGWHPHLHVILFLARPLEPEKVEELREMLLARWCQKVKLVLGPGHVPDDEHGCKLTKLHEAKYLSKMGLEMTDFAARKKGRGENRTAWQIAVDAVDGLDSKDLQERRKGVSDRKLWLNYAASIKGCRILTHTKWVSQLRASIGIADESDAELGGDEGQDEGQEDVREVVVIRLEPFQWNAVRCVRGGRGRLLDLAEQGSSPAVLRQFILSCRRVVGENEDGRVVRIDQSALDLDLGAPS